MKKLIVLLVMALIFRMGLSANDRFEKYQVNFIYNFTRLIQWPNLHNHPEFVIAVFGKNHPLTVELKATVGDRKVGGREIRVAEFSSLEEIGFCHLLFVPNYKMGQIKRISETLAGSPVVLVTEVQGLQPAESVINLSVEESKMGFQVNERVAKQRNLMLSTQLIQYSRK